MGRKNGSFYGTVNFSLKNVKFERMRNQKTFFFRPVYFALFVLLFLVELYIGIYVKDDFIRPYGGDYLVVILIYCFLKSFWNESPFKVGLYVLIFSFIVEFLQYFKIVEILGLGDNKTARILIGTSFAVEDLAAYFLGILTVWGVEKLR